MASRTRDIRSCRARPATGLARIPTFRPLRQFRLRWRRVGRAPCGIERDRVAARSAEGNDARPFRPKWGLQTPGHRHPVGRQAGPHEYLGVHSFPCRSNGGNCPVVSSSCAAAPKRPTRVLRVYGGNLAVHGGRLINQTLLRECCAKSTKRSTGSNTGVPADICLNSAGHCGLRAPAKRPG